MDDQGDDAARSVAKAAARKARMRAFSGPHAPEAWPHTVRELNAAYDAIQLAKRDRAITDRLVQLRAEGKCWSDVLIILTGEFRGRSSLP